MRVQYGRKVWGALGAMAALTGSALAQGDEASGADRGTVSLVIENDAFADDDRNYTNGLKLAYVLPARATPQVARSVARGLFRGDDEASYFIGFAVGQSIFTPDDTETAVPLPGQHPYAGWLYGEVSLVQARATTLDTLSLEAGIVGPSAGGEEVQNGFHDWIGNGDALGWDNQLHDEFGAVLTYERKWRSLAEMEFWRLGVDFSPSIGASAGNVLTQARVGGMVRLGTDLKDDYGPPRVRPSLTAPGTFDPAGPVSWYLFLGVDGRAVAQNIFLDGNSDGDSLSVDKKTFVADAQAGLVVQVGQVQIGYTYVARTKEFDTQVKNQRFGAVTVSARF